MTTLEKLFSLEGKTAIVTGGAQGIGKAVACAMAEVGADIVIFDLQEEKAQKAAKELQEKTGRKVLAVKVDVTDPEDVKKAVLEADSRMGQLDLLFNNAGIGIHVSAYDATPEQWLKVINVNLNGVYFMAAEFARYLVDRGRKGAICNTASMSGHIVNIPQGQAAYNASKAGVIQLTKSLAIEYCNRGIRVNCISPGYIYTEMTGNVRQDYQDKWMELSPMGRYGRPEELAGGVIYLLSDGASFTSGTDLVMDGCYTAF